MNFSQLFDIVTESIHFSSNEFNHILISNYDVVFGINSDLLEVKGKEVGDMPTLISKVELPYRQEIFTIYHKLECVNHDAFVTSDTLNTGGPDIKFTVKIYYDNKPIYEFNTQESIGTVIREVRNIIDQFITKHSSDMNLN